MDVKEIKIIGGFGRAEQKEPVNEVILKMGDVVSIVGPTGYGKTSFIRFLPQTASHVHKVLRYKI